MRTTRNGHPATLPLLRCAVYTRKSTEEGLEQEFNSLDAQRESGELFVKSQAGEGWALMPDRYDDGGFTGGNMERPGLRRLMADIEAGKVDVVVVYKVDRLSRSLLDFAQMMQAFEKYKVLNEREVRARYEVALEQYNKVVNIEGISMVQMANRYILPAALEYQKRVAESVAATKAAGADASEGKALLDELSGLVNDFRRRTATLQKSLYHSSAESA